MTLEMDRAVTAEQDTSENQGELGLWDRRYRAEGHIWGDNPSVTAKHLVDILRPSSKVLEIGFGYGRDLVLLLQEGHRIYGIEEAAYGLTEATRQLQQYMRNGNAHLILGAFNSADIQKESFDAVLSHRVLHLLGENGLTDAFARRAAYALRPGGLLYVSARNPNDFNKDQMVMTGNNTAEYKDPARKGQQISFWNKERFNKVFGDKFDIESLEDHTEIEATSNPVPTHFTVMKAHKKKSDGGMAPTP